MALKIQLADGTEPPCHKCGKPFKAGEIKVERPVRFDAQRRPGEDFKGGHYRGWVHKSCAPTKTSKHTPKHGVIKKKKGRLRAAT